MSRLLVQNLPVYVTPVKLREHFSQSAGPGGTITDVQVAHKSDGTSRRFGFVGYKTDAEATAAKEWFNRTYIDTTKIKVQTVDGTKDAPEPRPNKRPRLGPSPNDPLEKPSKKSKQNTDKPVKEDKQFDEFAQVMKPRQKKTWANEAAPSAPADVPPPSSIVVDNKMMDVDDPAVSKMENEEMSDLEWMRRRMKDSAAVGEKAFEQSDDEAPPIDEPEPEKAPVDSVKETILQTSRLFVRNLAFSCTEQDLRELFSPFGDISQVHIPLDPVSKQSKGVAYVTFRQSIDAVSAYEALDGKSFQGRLVHVLAAVDRKPQFEVVEGDGRKKTVKGERAAQRKAAAGKEFNWSMLYMNSDAVASSIADRMQISKADILNPEGSDNAAVKLALAETHIINETKAYFEAEGVLLDSFGSRTRSDTIILVKNIPYGTTSTQIEELFKTHGELTRILVPPAGTIAVVEFARADQAKKAYHAVAYSRMGNSVVYVEKGPMGMFGDGPVVARTEGAPPSEARVVKIAEQTTYGDTEEIEPSLASGTTLFVKNLSFATTNERLVSVFGNLPSFSFARIQTKPDPKRPGGRLSMGYGFIGFKEQEGAQRALKSMQGFVLDGHALHVKFAGRGTEGQESKESSKSRTTKMIIKNVPFEATKKDIRELVSSYGTLKSVRLPKKFDSRSRGFAFLDFISRAEAENAYSALRHTHLLGRHLVLQWAEEGEQDLEVLRKKAGVGLGTGGEMPGRKRKLDMGKTGEEDPETFE
ncbi:hypothetical protein MIND_00790300 [Mycena indigotica]|uniref:RRM domain-containing protein n=1 Tax=Mycena indigotica TaxID=2126181 RepID=A0A8H6SM99_9AGAR|nr:uncharacterized protein MIND_00790300 [Mycena indigotica]KAF7302233.1 hypothetical protein MIND_00790300 [Mycena indigotica]